jgi:hypothetical protein
VVEILRNSGTRTLAAGRAKVAMSTFMTWMDRGASTSSGKYYDFLIAVRDAEAQAILRAIQTVELKIVGGWHRVPMRDLDGNYVFRRDAAGEILRDAQDRPAAEFVDVYTEPDDARAVRFLKCRVRKAFGSGAGEGLTVNMNPSWLARPSPGKKEKLNMFAQAVQILIDKRDSSPK